MPAESARPTNPADLVAWYAEMGIDVALEEAPVDHFATRAPVGSCATACSVAAPVIRP